jgi:hypothetical protein
MAIVRTHTARGSRPLTRIDTMYANQSLDLFAVTVPSIRPGNNNPKETQRPVKGFYRCNKPIR